ncbi:MAG: hypothetical protein K8S94_17065 [Planctomycetia bacterium]|nr:hypothetical protein [Planctomycetia bacterium]
MADIVFAFDPAIHRPIAVPQGVSAEIAETITTAAVAALEQAAAVASKANAGGLVLCGRILDPARSSPAQAARLRQVIISLAARGCRTVLLADDNSFCHDISRMLGEPRGLFFVTPLAPLEFEVRGLAIEIVSAHGPSGAGSAAAFTAAASPLHRRIVIGWDSALWNPEPWTPDEPEYGVAPTPAILPSAAAFASAAAASTAWSQPGTFWIWASRHRQSLPPGVHFLPALQARAIDEASAGNCCTLTLLDREPREASADDDGFATPHADWRGTWHEVPTHRVSWRTVSVESPAGGDEELATTIWGALENLPADRQPVLEIVRCSVACGTSVARRVRIGEIAAETLARVRDLYDAKSFRVWCQEIVAEPTESLAPLGHARSGSRPGSTTSFSSALADIVTLVEQSQAIPADQAREAGWLALELIESV